jgi:hypothetical protein
MKSACYFCPFNALKADAIERHKAHPEQVADALMLDTREMTIIMDIFDNSRITDIS